MGMAAGCVQIYLSTASIKRLTLKRPIAVPSSRIMPMMLRLTAELQLSTNSSCTHLGNAIRSASTRWVRSRYAYRQGHDTSNTANIEFLSASLISPDCLGITHFFMASALA